MDLECREIEASGPRFHHFRLSFVPPPYKTLIDRVTPSRSYPFYGANLPACNCPLMLWLTKALYADCGFVRRFKYIYSVIDGEGLEQLRWILFLFFTNINIHNFHRSCFMRDMGDSFKVAGPRSFIYTNTIKWI